MSCTARSAKCTRSEVWYLRYTHSCRRSLWSSRQCPWCCRVCTRRGALLKKEKKNSTSTSDNLQQQQQPNLTNTKQQQPLNQTNKQTNRQQQQHNNQQQQQKQLNQQTKPNNNEKRTNKQKRCEKVYLAKTNFFKKINKPSCCGDCRLRYSTGSRTSRYVCKP